MKMLNVNGICTLLVAAILISLNTLAADIKSPLPQAADLSVKSYREWKTAMVDSAELRVQKIKLTLEQQRQVSGANIDPNLKNQLSKEQLQATLASELTINDYFVGYLNKKTNLQQAIKGVAGKLNDDEVAELMSAYAYSFNKNEMKPLRSATGSSSGPAAD